MIATQAEGKVESIGCIAHFRLGWLPCMRADSGKGPVGQNRAWPRRVSHADEAVGSLAHRLPLGELDLYLYIGKVLVTHKGHQSLT